MDAILRLVSDAHARMCPAVPLVGWDVALTTEGRCLLMWKARRYRRSARTHLPIDGG